MFFQKNQYFVTFIYWIRAFRVAKIVFNELLTFVLHVGKICSRQFLHFVIRLFDIKTCKMKIFKQKLFESNSKYFQLLTFGYYDKPIVQYFSDDGCDVVMAQTLIHSPELQTRTLVSQHFSSTDSIKILQRSSVF